MRRVMREKRRATVSAFLVVVLSYGDGTPFGRRYAFEKNVARN